MWRILISLFRALLLTIRSCASVASRPELVRSGLTSWIRPAGLFLMREHRASILCSASCRYQRQAPSNPARLPNPSMERQHSHPGELERNRFSHHHSDHPLVISTALEAADSKIASLRLGSIARTAQAAPRMRTGSTISIVELRISVALHFGTTTNHFRLRLAMKRI